MAQPETGAKKPFAKLGNAVSAGAAKTTSFWERVTEGMELSELWAQFSSEARAGYGLYSADVDWEAVNRQTGWRRAMAAARAFFWAMLTKLTPARRVLLLLALALFLVGLMEFRSAEGPQLRGWAFLLLFLLLALELADRVTMKRDLEIAREIQRWLVPEAPPQVPGLEIAFATRPANTIAGDYYDVFFRDPGQKRLLFVVADVAGKSVPAALLMATFQAGLHALSSSGAPFQELVDALNHFVCARSLSGQRFTTAFLAELDLETRALAYANAGHNAPALRRVAGNFERLEKGGLPFGIDSAARYDLGRTRFERGDLLLAFTDGLIEAADDKGEEYGEDRVFHLLDAVPGESAGETIRHLLENVDRFAGAAQQHDDITCLVVQAV